MLLVKLTTRPLPRRRDAAVIWVNTRREEAWFHARRIANPYVNHDVFCVCRKKSVERELIHCSTKVV